MGTGKKLYVPKVVIDEIEDIKREDRLPTITTADGFKQLTQYARIGREVNRIRKLDFTRSVKMPTITIPSIPKPKKRKRKKHAGFI